ncbi:immune-induced peptides [Drosophila sechellia]|uniref:GM15695 n=1 Tax=Drosophila sechellia TaxID=7238 RepID=B4I7U5_DROSE|nr:immune-induced peptides [Drosophila sechellia]EDW56670.1 GM15695 [Drosophila sechellia]
MRSYTLLVFIVSTLLFAVANAQQNYDGRNGPHEFGTPGNGIYIRGQNEGPYTVPGVGGTFQNSPSSGQHSYTDEHGNTYTHSSTPTATSLASAPLGFSLGGVLVLLMSLITI